MTKIFLHSLLVAISATTYAQDFSKNLATANSAYAAGKLEDARFAMQQMMNDIDIAIGKEVIKLLPVKLEALNANVKNDNVTINTGFTGTLVHRLYEKPGKTGALDIMSNSPLVASLNAILAMPFIGNAGDGSQKTVKVKGYKGVLQKNVNSETNVVDYTLQIPFGSTLLTFTLQPGTEEETLRLANLLPLPELAKKLQ